MLSQVLSWLLRTLGGKGNSSHSLFLLSRSFNKHVKNKALIAHLREAVELLNAEGYQQVIQTKSVKAWCLDSGGDFSLFVWLPILGARRTLLCGGCLGRRGDIRGWNVF